MLAQKIQAGMFREFISPGFNAEIQKRAQVGRTLTQLDILQLRWGGNRSAHGSTRSRRDSPAAQRRRCP